MARSGDRLPVEDLLALYERMLLIRQTEMRLSKLFADGEVPGFIHLSIGQEAIAAGVGAALDPEDTVASTHRGHGHALAKGVPLDRFFLELLGRAEGSCGGRGGSMHVADMSVGMLGANGIVGAGLPIALGSALAHDALGRSRLAAAFFGDGSLAEGAFHETLNMAALWSLPLLLVCENNGWAEFSPTARQFVSSPTRIAEAFGVAAETVDGNDVEVVAKAARRIAGEMRARPRPRMLECKTHRVRGHFEGDPQRYRSEAEMAELEKFDPLARCVATLRKRGVADARLEDICTRIEAEIEACVAAARRGAEPDFGAALRDVYATRS